MKKFLVIIAVVLVFLFANFAYAQDCGKCPLKSKCAKEKQTVKKEEVQTPMVYVNKTDKLYHQENCKVVKDQEGYKAITLADAQKAEMKACTACNPVVKPEPSQEKAKKEEKKS